VQCQSVVAELSESVAIDDNDGPATCYGVVLEVQESVVFDARQQSPDLSERGPSLTHDDGPSTHQGVISDVIESVVLR